MELIQVPINKHVEKWTKSIKPTVEVMDKPGLNQYLQILRERKPFKMKPIKGEVSRKHKIGEVVILKEANQPRGKWKMAKVQGLIQSHVDNQHRATQVLLPSGKVLKRPLRLSYPVEMCD